MASPRAQKRVAATGEDEQHDVDDIRYRFCVTSLVPSSGFVEMREIVAQRRKSIDGPARPSVGEC